MRYALLAALTFATVAAAQPYPARPIRVIVAYPAGGQYDLVARVVAQKWGEAEPQPMIVENRAGANGIVGTEHVAKAAADGYTLLLGGSGPNGINQALYPKLPYDTLRDFKPIVAASSQPNLLVAHPSLNVASLTELVSAARAKPGEIAYASNGAGSSNHLCMELLANGLAIRLNHVPFKGASPAVAATLGGQTALHFGTPADLVPQIKAGKLRVLATSGARRAAILPDAPTIAESGIPGYGCFSWLGYLAPAGTADEVIAKLNSVINRILEMPDVRERIAPGGSGEIIGGAPEVYANLIRSEIAKWTKVVREAGVKVD